MLFLKLAQDQVGESDFVFTKIAAKNMSQSGDLFMYGENAFEHREPIPVVTLPFVNTTELEQVCLKYQYLHI